MTKIENVVILNKFYGLNNMQADYVNSFNYLQEAINVDIDRNYRIKSRKGYFKILDSAAHSIWSDGKICLFREGKYLKLLNDDYTTTILRDNLTTEPVKMSYLSLLDKVYYSDGQSKGIIEKGRDRSWGLVPPKDISLSKVPNGTLKAGEYRIAITYVRSDGQESGSSIPIGINIHDNMNIAVTVPASNDSDVVGINVYVTEANGYTYFLYSKVTNNDSIVIISDTLHLKRKIQTLFLKDPPVGEMLTFWGSRIFIVANNVLYYTEPFAYELFHHNNYIAFDTNIQGIIPVDNCIWIGTENSIFCLTGSTPPFSISKTIDYGMVRGTIQMIPGSLLSEKIQDMVGIFATEKGVCVAGPDGLFINLTENIYSFPQAFEGNSLFQEEDGLYKYILLLREATESLNVYSPIGNKIVGYVPEFSVIAEASGG